jgi:2-polyprenyl-3-methyl-5-hydroxy-6-metoxy-1,4-benzoquinol methylase
MSEPIPAEFWNARFGEDGFAYGERASRLLMGFTDKLRAGLRALVPAAGEGRDAVFLAQCGLDVTAVDISPVGLDKAEALAQARGVSITCVEADLAEWSWPAGGFDIVAAMFLHVPEAGRAGLHARMLGALKPGGHVFLEGFTKHQRAFQESHNSGGPPVESMLFAPDEIRADFASAETLAFWTGVEHLTEGPYHTGPAALLRAVWRKPE